MAFADVLNPQGYEQLNLVGLSSTNLYFVPSKVTSNPDILEQANSDIFSSAKSYYKINLTANERYNFYFAGNSKDNSAIIADGNLYPIVLNLELNDGSDPGYWDIIEDFIPKSSGTYYIKPSWLTNTGSVIVYKMKSLVAADTSPPTVTTFIPADEAANVAVSSNIVVTFSEAIVRGIGNIVLKTAAGVTVATYDAATSSNLSISNSTLTLNPTADLAVSTSYTVQFTAGSIKDLAGNWYAGTTSYNFTTESSQIIQGSSGNDTINGGTGNDTINGGAGTDMAAYAGFRSNYTITKTATGYTVRDATSVDGTDTLTNVEQLQFVDHTVNLAQMDRVFKYFVAYYGRAPASTGKDYWLDNLSGTFANDEKQLVWNFGSATQAEFINLYGSGGTVSDFVSKVYSNLFNRTPLQTGLDYWGGVYDDKKAEGKDDNAIRGEMVTWIMDGATDSATNKDLTTLNNKVLAASMFTAAVDTPAELAGYRIASNTAALDYAREWLHEITNNSTSLNSHIDATTLDQTIIQLVGLYEPVG